MKKINIGDKIALVAPSGQIGSAEKISSGLQYLETLGFKPIFMPHLFAQNRYMAGSDQERADDINRAFADPEIKAIFCVRAAAGASRILPYIDYSLICRNPKPLIGFCDNVALQLALFQKSDLISWNGFLPTYDFKDGSLDSLVQESLEKLIKGEPIKISSGQSLVSGKTQGRLICCNLSVLMRLAGTPYFPDLSGTILLLEDVHERLHKIDLMLQQLKQQPHFDKIKGLILGKFTDCSGDEEDGTLEDCFRDFLENTEFPVLTDFEFSHNRRRYVLPLGASAVIDTDRCLLEIGKY